MTPQDQTWTVKAILDWCEGYLADKGDAQPRLSAQWLLGEATGLTRIELYTHLDEPLSKEERATMRAWVQRRGAGEPLQLICGAAPFRHMVLKVAPGVLIPRPETEVLVSEVLALFPVPKQISAYAFEDERVGKLDAMVEVMPDDMHGSDDSSHTEGGHAESVESDQSSDQSGESAGFSESIRVIDLCTGSGCIACALATEHPHMHVLALDIAPEALTLAQENVNEQGVSDRVEILESNLLSAVTANAENKGSFDVIVSNPPYIPSCVLDTLDAEVNDYEPRLALDGGADGLDLFHRFVGDAYELLKPGGVLAVELFEDSLEVACDSAYGHGFADARIVQDLAGRNRVLIATK